MFDNHTILLFWLQNRPNFSILSLLYLCFFLYSLDLAVLRAQRIIGFFILITHKSTRSENPDHIVYYSHLQKLAMSVTLANFDDKCYVQPRNLAGCWISISRHVCYLPAGRFVFIKTVPEVLIIPTEAKYLNVFPSFLQSIKVDKFTDLNCIIRLFTQILHSLKQSKLITPGFRWPWARSEISPAPGTTQIAAFAGRSGEKIKHDKY